MFVIPKHRRLVFTFRGSDLAIHATPKVAATSIRNSCLKAIGVSVPPIADKQFEAGPFLKSIDEINKSSFLVMTVRHPVHRVVSVWADKVMSPGRMPKVLSSVGVHKYMSFSEFVKVLAEKTPSDSHVVPQSILLGYREPNFVIVYEKLNDDWSSLRRWYNFLPALPRSNVSDAAVKIEAYNDKESIEIIRELYKDDFKAFGYV